MDWLSILTDGLRAAVGPEAAVFALIALGLNVHFGYTGLLNFGQVAFVLVGAYGTATVVSHGVGGLWVGLFVAIMAAICLGLALGGPTLRLRADYLAITTIAAAEILRYIARSGWAEPLTGGVFGLTKYSSGFYAANPIPRGSYGIGTFAFDERALWLMCVAWGAVVAASLLVLVLVRSPWGRIVRAIREDDDAVRSTGKNVFKYRMQALCLGGVFGAIGGALLALNRQAISPDIFILQTTVFAFTILLLGGAARVWGPVAGSVIFWFIMSTFDSFLRTLVKQGVVSENVLSGQTIGALGYVLVGLGLIALMLFRPQGVFGDKRELVLND